MEITYYQIQYLAYELTRRCPSDSAEKMTGAVVRAQVDSNPHQVDKTMLAFRCSLWCGQLPADGARLEKTFIPLFTTRRSVV